MEVKNKPAYKDHKPNLIPEAIEITMEELDMTRDEAVRFMTETSYQVKFGKKRKKKKAEHDQKD